MKTNEVKKYIDGLSPQQRKDYVKSLSDRLLEYQRVIDKHRDYLESLPTKELRIKKLEKITNEYFERKNYETGINENV